MFLNSFLTLQSDEGNEHLLHGDATMLECIPVVGHVVVVIVRVGKETVARREDIAVLRLGEGSNTLRGSLISKTSLGLYFRFLPSL